MMAKVGTNSLEVSRYMVPETVVCGVPKNANSSWKAGLVLDTPALATAIYEVLEEISTTCVFQLAATTARFEVASSIEREHPDILFVELARIEGSGSEWIEAVRAGNERPVIIAVNPEPEPQSMIDALRAGASEFLCLPLRPAIFDAMERIRTILESQQSQNQERGRLTGILSAKGGCGATTLACHFAFAIRAMLDGGKVLVADLDPQAPAAHTAGRVRPPGDLAKVFESVRRLHFGTWPDYVAKMAPGIDVLAGHERRSTAALTGSVPEPWRIDSLFRFLTRNYTYILADLGRNLNPANWSFLQNLDDLILVTAPDVLALYQTRQVMQILTVRGFDKSRLRLILNRNHSGPRDFWVESIEQMFEMKLSAVIPEDKATFAALSRDQFEFPAASSFGRAVTKAAGRLFKPGNEPPGKGATKKAA